jgi:preprotein translocase subunit SecB
MKPSPLQLERHFFTKVHVDAHPDGDPTAKPEVQTQVDVAQAERDPKRYQLTLRLKLVSVADKKLGYTAEIQVVGVVRVADSWPDPAVQQLVQVNGPALLYGAAREMLCNITGRGPWPMVCLHSVSFVEPKALAQAPTAPHPVPEAAGSRKR